MSNLPLRLHFRRATLFVALAIVACIGVHRTNLDNSRLGFVQLLVVNRSGETADLRVNVDDSTLYYAQIRTVVTPSEISGTRLIELPLGDHVLVVHDFTHGQQLTRQLAIRREGLYVLVTTQSDGSHITVSTKNPL
jgi:hypothetical protein